jgi:hypothetical protein
MLGELHANVPEADRPMSMSDLSDEQAERARKAVRKVLVASMLSKPAGHFASMSELESRLSSTDEVERVAIAVASEIDAIDDELANTSALAVPDKQEFRHAASERIARAAIASMVTKP